MRSAARNETNQEAKTVQQSGTSAVVKSSGEKKKGASFDVSMAPNVLTPSCGQIGGVRVALESSRVEPACPKAAPLGRRETTKPKLISTLHYFGVKNSIKESICVNQKSVCIAAALHSPKFCVALEDGECNVHIDGTNQ